MSNRIPTFEEYCARRYREDLDRNIAEKNLTKTGVDDFLEKFPSFTREQVEEQIATNDMFVCFLIKDPVLQNCYERYCEEYITKYSPVKCEKLANNSRKTSLYLYCGKVYSYDAMPATAKGHTKSIDFKFTYNGYTIYASHKHTRKDGGNQNNQWHDLDVFGEHASMTTDDKVLFVALADGEYYTRKKKNRKTKMELLNEHANEHFQAMTTTDFCSWVVTLH